MIFWGNTSQAMLLKKKLHDILFEIRVSTVIAHFDSKEIGGKSKYGQLPAVIIALTALYNLSCNLIYLFRPFRPGRPPSVCLYVYVSIYLSINLKLIYSTIISLSVHPSIYLI